MLQEVQIPKGKRDTSLTFENITHVYGSATNQIPTIDGISFRIDGSRFVSLVGPSGCGKTTLLRMCAGFAQPTGGKVLVGGKPIKGVNSDVGYVTQDSKLFPWKTVLENVEFPLHVRGIPREERRHRALEMMEMAGLTGFEEHYPYQLSGGMQKRASIIRTLIYEPDAILMDEPFGSLDAQTRMVLQNELLQIWETQRPTILFVTHDLTEAIILSDEVIILSKRPARIQYRLPIDLPRPRDVFNLQTQDDFIQLFRELWQHFKLSF